VGHDSMDMLNCNGSACIFAPETGVCFPAM
jgi:hypothetical protein